MSTDVTSQVRAGIGTSVDPDAAQAGREAAAIALAALGREQPALILVYASVRYDLPLLIKAVREITGTTPLAGATSSGHFHNGGVTPPGQGIAVLALTAGPYRFGIGSVTGLRRDAFAAGKDLARAAQQDLGEPIGKHSALLVLVDGLAGDQQAFLNGVHKVVGAAVPVVGGAAGDDRRITETAVFDGDEILTESGAVAIWISSPWPLAVVADHGWHPIGLPLLVTKVDGTIVHEIAGRPAADVFREHFRSDEQGQELGWVRKPGYHSAHAFGLIEPDGTQLIRGAYLDDDGQLHTFCPLPTYSAVQIVTCQAPDLLEVTDGVVERTVAGRDPSVILAFSCVARLDILQNHGAAEAARLQTAAGDVPTFGFYTYGEFARTGRVAGYHNATLAAIAL
ncbi:hypothetical protein F4553_001251 [Allocatelliglobosispora scoriae]|uniref:Histidine kinase n=1 Tax=Allocatelliglobosispora scoriae TaxID=643052 RepID=A0A841BM89_9ACTN|nr:FIST N-terminal domain-containing protein [Allocatelliglobosispora scoriae]MBB5867872.1 hypothetical protein [Allocatelliglobosispora scoriae]